MKTKHILTALALPVMFAACTADDIVSENNGLQQAERAKLSKDFVLKTAGGVESRYAVVGSTKLDYNYEKGDKIGAAIVDKFEGYTATETYDPKDPTTWTIIETLAGNNPFEFDGVETWSCASELGIGNYIFTYPYNAKDNSRGAVKWELPRVQQYDSENPNAIVEANNKSIAAAVIKEGDTELDLDLKNLYTYPKFNLIFDNGEDITKVTKVILKYEDPVVYKGGLDHKKVVALFADDYDAYVAAGATVTNAKALWGVKSGETYNANKHKLNWKAVQTSDMIITSTSSIYAEVATTEYLIFEMDQKVSKVDNTSNKSASVRLMMPSVEDFILETGITMYVVTDNGTYAQTLNAGACKFKATTSNESKEQALWRNKSNTLTINGGWDEGNLDLGYIVTTAKDWNNLVKLYGDSKNFDGTKDETTGDYINDPLEVSILSSDFALTSELDMPEVAIFSINKANVEGEVTLSNVIATELNVKEGASLTTSASLQATTINVEEGAELTFAAAIDAETEKVVEYASVAKVNNLGTVTVDNGAIAKFELENDSEKAVLNVGAAVSRAAAEAVANLNGGWNKGTIANNGVINVVADFENEEPSTDKANIDEDGNFIFVPTINNNGTFNSKAVTTNSGKFINAGTLTSNFSAGNEFNNEYILDVKAGASTYIDDNENGKIYLAEKAPAKFTIYGHDEAADYEDAERGIIIMKVTGKSNKLDLSNSPVNTLYVEGDLELTKTFTYTDDDDKTIVKALENVYFVGDGSLKIPAYTLATDKTTKVYTAQISTLTLAKGVEVAISGTVNAVDAIVVGKEAVLDIPVEAKLTIDYADITFGALTGDEASKVVVNGTLVLPDKEGDEDGVIETAPAGVEVTKQGSLLGEEDTTAADQEAATTAKNTAIQNALKPLIEAWVRYTDTAWFTANEVDSWADVTFDVIKTCPWEQADGVWEVNAGATAGTFTFAQDFVDAYNDIDEATTDDITIAGIAGVISANKTNVETVITAIKTAANNALAANIATAVGKNTWTSNVYTKLTSSQATKAIYKNGDKNTLMLAEFDTKLTSLTNSSLATLVVGTIDNAAWLSLNDAKAATTWKAAESSASYLPSKSYIPVYSESDEYKVVAAYVKMVKDANVQAVTSLVYGSEATEFAEVSAYLSKLYQYAATSTAEYYADKAITAAVTTTILDNAKTFEAYTSDQFDALLDIVKKDMGVTIP